MSDALEFVISSYLKTHRLVLEVAVELSDTQLGFQPSRTAPHIAFHLWHLARYADSLPGQIGFEGGDIWRAEGLAEHWGLSPETLGIYESGTGMDADAPGQISWPSGESLLDYCRRAFEAADEAVGKLDAEHLRREAKRGGSVAAALMTNLEHDNRHLGMMECLLGVMGYRGSAST